jgi:hypothetical protein
MKKYRYIIQFVHRDKKDQYRSSRPIYNSPEAANRAGYTRALQLVKYAAEDFVITTKEIEQTGNLFD